MKACLCTMAGTRACDTCVHGPSQYPPDIVFPSFYEPVESDEEKIRRIIREELDRRE